LPVPSSSRPTWTTKATSKSTSGLIGLDLQSQQAGSKITVSGSALVTGLYFHDEVVTTIDASALTNKATHRPSIPTS
jgi:hypothetical protein